MRQLREKYGLTLGLDADTGGEETSEGDELSGEHCEQKMLLCVEETTEGAVVRRMSE